MLPCYDQASFPFFMALRDKYIVIVNSKSGKVFNLVVLRQLNKDDEISEFELTYTLKDGS